MALRCCRRDGAGTSTLVLMPPLLAADARFWMAVNSVDGTLLLLPRRRWHIDAVALAGHMPCLAGQDTRIQAI